MQEGVKNIFSKSACSISVYSKSAASIKDYKSEGSIEDTNPAASAYDNKLQSSCNGDHMLYCRINRVHVDRAIYLRTAFKPDPIKKLVQMEKEQNIDYDTFFQGKGKIFVLNCYIFL